MTPHPTATQFAWACCEAGDYLPPEPTRKNTPRYGPDDACWLCGGPTHGIGWPRKLGLADTFCDHNKAARLDSDTVCQACVATSSSEGWRQYVAAHPDRGLWAWFPEKPGTKPRSFNWLYTSHLFRPGHHETPDRPRWREILIDPPEPLLIRHLASEVEDSEAFADGDPDAKTLVEKLTGASFADLVATVERLGF